MGRALALESAGQLGLGFGVEEMTPTPESEWVPPAELPDRLHGVVGVDTETNDPGLRPPGGGPAWPWRGGHLAGVSVVADNFRGYLPIGHAGEGNLDKALIVRWLRAVLGDERQLKVFANALYDVGWLSTEDVVVRGPVRDAQLEACLLDENRLSYSLDALARTDLGRRKNEDLLRAAADAYHVHPKAELWKLPPRYVGPYAEDDADLAVALHAAYEPRLVAEGLTAVCELEHDLLPMYHDLRRRGVRIDEDRAERLALEYEVERDRLVAEVQRQTGVEVSLWAAASIARALDAVGVTYGRTAKLRSPSITRGFLEGHPHPVCRLLVQARERDKLASGFLRGQLLGHLHRGRVHGQVHPLRGEDGGTTTGRLSMSDPNLQQVPKRTEQGKRLRTVFLPEDGEWWNGNDFASQEPRLLVHFASLARRNGQPLPGAAELVARYRERPDTDLHQEVCDLMNRYLFVERFGAKTLNLARIYGRGVATTAAALGLTKEQTVELFAQHARAIPFAKDLADLAKQQVERRGYITSLLGRRVRFELWEPAAWDERDAPALPRKAAERRWPNQRLVRARAHKALNSVIQPSAADQTKLAMRALWRAGLGRHVLVQVHDELGSSVPDFKTGEEIAEVMETAVTLEIPSLVEPEFGRNWGEMKTREEWVRSTAKEQAEDDGRRR